MSEETAAAIARRTELREALCEGLALVVEHASRIKDARAELAGEINGVFDPAFVYDKPFRRAVDDLAYAAHVAQQLNPIQEVRP